MQTMGGWTHGLIVTAPSGGAYSEKHLGWHAMLWVRRKNG
jgi:hypothetical protein